ncbi:BTAD domain-containing putative transcriptional regulator [Micromonospora sp. KC723]|uniref:AfsR/SARP family transcriptional regulator n=1 Tax=Micromonospora sp. KC723 TaxID=2530381 RepID=UPI0010477697|nr:BTAD domain-containing putative transcriptional regulator [Micromonospora sp. KC723]TDB78440.1 tetratricopeptide repeat protein [Micromonospora sp. KC723]
MDGVEFRVLGPVGAWRDGQQLRPTNAQQRTILAMLLLAPGHVVPLGQMVTALWGDGPPASARNAIQGHVSRLRRLVRGIPGVELATAGHGYQLTVPRESVDLHRFRGLVEQAQNGLTSPDELLRSAVGLWRGPAFADVAGEWLPATLGQTLEQERVAAIEELSRAELSAGRTADAVARLAAVVAEHPMRENAVALWMTALHRAGRRTEALEVFRETRLRLTRDLGIEPSDELHRVHQAVLADDLPVTPPVRDTPCSRQLPTEVPHFTGRTAELAALDALLESRHAGVAIAVVSGAPGAGKTALTVHWAHRVVDRFPDGQLFVNLRGFDTRDAAMDPAEALRRLLAGLGVPAKRLPASVDEQSTLFRTVVAQRRVLIVLDNARDAAQVRPLLPGAPGCFVLVNSRDQLAGLVAGHGATPLPLGRPSAVEARAFLAKRLGGERVTGESRAAAEIVESCGRLHLALAVVAARAATNPRLTLASLAAELRESRGRLDALANGDSATDVRTVFSWSYRSLGPATARVFRWLGLHIGPDISLSAAANLTGLPVSRARALIGELIRAHLIEEHTPGRYLFHDLLRAYAEELARATEPAEDRRRALRRLLDHYLHSAGHVATLVEPNRPPVRFEPRVDDVHVDEPTDRKQALAWFAAERVAVLAAIDRAAAEGFAAHAWQLAWAIKPWLSRQWHRHDQVRAQRTAVAMATKVGDTAAEAVAYRYLADGYDRLGRHDDAETNYRYALDRYRAVDDRAGQAHVQLDVARMRDRQNRHREAVGHLKLALDLFRAEGDDVGEARTLAALGWEHAQLGEYGEALVHCRAGLALLRASADRHGEAAGWDSMGYIHHQRGAYSLAIRCYEHSLEMWQECGDRMGSARTLISLGESRLAAGEVAECGRAWRRALALLHGLDAAAAAALAERMRRLSRQGSARVSEEAPRPPARQTGPG